MRRELKKIEDELEVILYDMTGVKGVRYDNTPGAFNPRLHDLKRLEEIDKYDDKLREYNYLLITINETEEILKRMPARLKPILNDIYVKGMTYRNAGEKYGYSDHGLWEYLKRETERFL